MNELEEGKNLEGEDDIVGRNEEPLMFSKALDYVAALQKFANVHGIVSVMDTLSEVSSLLNEKFYRSKINQNRFC